MPIRLTAQTVAKFQPKQNVITPSAKAIKINELANAAGLCDDARGIIEILLGEPLPSADPTDGAWYKLDAEIPMDGEGDLGVPANRLVFHFNGSVLARTDGPLDGVPGPWIYRSNMDLDDAKLATDEEIAAELKLWIGTKVSCGFLETSHPFLQTKEGDISL